MDLKFDLRSMHRLETDVKVLLRTINVRDIEDLTRSVLNGRNKDSVVEFAVNLGKLLKNSEILLKRDTADLDSLKCEQLENQSKLLKVQNELSVKKSVHLDAVKNTVEEKLSSWAAVVKKNSGNKVTQKEMKKAVIVNSAMNERDRKFNVIMFNVEGQDDDDPVMHAAAIFRYRR